MYLAFKTLHVLADIAFLGNITVGLFWKKFADSTKDFAITAYTVDGIIRADRIFTIPGAIIIVVAGVTTAIVGGIAFLSTGWLLWSIVLFIISGLAFGPLARVQRKLLAAARAKDAPLYEQLSKQWDLIGAIALIGPIIAAIFMILKPALPAFHASAL